MLLTGIEVGLWMMAMGATNTNIESVFSVVATAVSDTVGAHSTINQRKIDGGCICVTEADESTSTIAVLLR